MECIQKRGQPELNRRPLDLQSNALPLSYTPNWYEWCLLALKNYTTLHRTTIRMFCVSYLARTIELKSLIKSIVFFSFWTNCECN